MQVIINTLKPTALDIEFPIYKSFVGFLKIISPSEAIRVFGNTIEHVENSEDRVSGYIIDGDDITEGQFINALSKAVGKYTDVLSTHERDAFEAATTPAEPEDYEDDTAYEIFERNNDLTTCLKAILHD